MVKLSTNVKFGWEELAKVYDVSESIANHLVDSEIFFRFNKKFIETGDQLDYNVYKTKGSKYKGKYISYVRSMIISDVMKSMVLYCLGDERLKALKDVINGFNKDPSKSPHKFLGTFQGK